MVERALSENTGKPAELKSWALWVRLTSSVGWEIAQAFSRPEASRAVGGRDRLLPAQPRLKPVLARFLQTQPHAGIE